MLVAVSSLYGLESGIIVKYELKPHAALSDDRKKPDDASIA